MNSPQIYDKIHTLAVIPILSIDSLDSVLPLADALIKGRLPIAEVTFRTSAAAEAISLLNKERPDIIVGAGTVLNVEDLRKAKDCGAQFAVSPGLNPDVVKEAIKIEMPFFPGVMTPSDIDRALGFGLTLLKFFPAEAAGGITMLKSIYAPYKHLGVKFVPTGGINAANMRDYLKLDAVLAVGGSWVATRADISGGNWPNIANNCLEIRETVKSIRS
ncbi:MAG: bifunctional 4-hydroxy-2-oxoglutarate aldolase/2-dehydro-3-deoxy-phosphogluconate aldolase [Phycisphaerae bacterium]|nr:bifunctional 4-hydroxy-2-oxoglutarate aldolase/2-dehydro-3-deoxy-phosphogluconate aldolase [Phycisphaerae bacterium]